MRDQRRDPRRPRPGALRRGRGRRDRVRRRDRRSRRARDRAERAVGGRARPDGRDGRVRRAAGELRARNHDGRAPLAPRPRARRRARTRNKGDRGRRPARCLELAPAAVARPSDPTSERNDMKTARPVPLFLTALVAFFSALAALAVSNGHDAHAHGNPGHYWAAPLTQEQVAFHDAMRRLWEDHITWTRLAIISLTTGSPDTDATVGRLLKNQTDIGNAVKPFYGAAAGNELTRQLKRHILIAAEVVAAAKAGDQAKLAAAQSRWTENGDAIAAVLASVNPRFWKLAPMKAELRMHLRLTTEEA